jgi:hypothetical protein
MRDKQLYTKFENLAMPGLHNMVRRMRKGAEIIRNVNIVVVDCFKTAPVEERIRIIRKNIVRHLVRRGGQCLKSK